MAQLDTTGAQTTSEGFVTCTTRPNSIEIAYNHYANRVGSPALPHTLELLGKIHQRIRARESSYPGTR